ncbi:hypothetical protein KP509_20G012000 [Ceratopteris richardii]|uniref:RIN4 pathogenic type III effector avirulence factor Avr cleavage site domain-containing protein n=1 Tax=Ceratopteris richardii TaxID=49495 RepID=A0A8T2SGU4_CERRI|nr:hypothetical protein KP509_20G012000 [Ceratopteris richardii]KAH7330996.1 hypothetical protein KP509_20G012000 [Ceratopteris richardii]KAH7330997.1 hypothetical protein KP509_20G012000 [Ceratopteris richardii]KAH7330998.1 hypothetical protein KP509_20G012000 [Ceratopteris richardii]KAH7330999.1 hypothetical protein KP509_20G012000 [Ceratopteris richardii]
MAIPIHALATDSERADDGGTSPVVSCSNPNARPPLLSGQDYASRLARKLQSGDARSGSRRHSIDAPRANVPAETYATMPGRKSYSGDANRRLSIDALGVNLQTQAYEGRLGRKLQPGDASRRHSIDGQGTAFPRKDQSDMGAVLPKFGEWDVTDPASGVGFTAIFEKVVVEKKTGKTAFFSRNAASLFSVKFRGSSERSAESSPIKNCCWCCCFHCKR